MKKWEIELMSVMAKSSVDNMQSDVRDFINNLLVEIDNKVNSMYKEPNPLEDSTQQWRRMGENRIVLNVSEMLKKDYFKGQN